MTDKLTIFMPLKGRHLHTLRWLWHADKVGLPYRVLVADGDVHPTIDRLLSNPATFPRVRSSYFRYADKCFSDFYRKCSESLDRIDTPYAMISDNDDFPLSTGIERCIEFLDANPEFVSAVGGIPGFSTAPRSDAWNGVTGPLSKVRYRCHDDGSYEPRGFDQPVAADRVLDLMRRYRCLYYSVYRTDALKTIMRELMEMDPSDLLIHEFYGGLRTLTLGKATASRGYLSYLRQGNTSLGSSFKTDWVDHLLRSRFPEDFQRLARQIASAAAPANPQEAERLEAEIHREFAAYLRTMLAGTMMRHRFPRLFKVKQALLPLKEAVKLPRAWRVANEERRFWRELAKDGVQAATMAGHRREMAEVKDTLQSEEFVRFVQRNAADLTSPAAY